MSASVLGAGVELLYEERGHAHAGGAAVLLVHGLASDHEAMLPLAGELAGAARVIAYSRRGYGGSDMPEPYDGTTVAEQAEDAAAVLRALGAGGAVAVGDGFGALIVIDLLRRHPGLVRAAVLSDAPLFAFVPEATRELAEERVLIEEAVFAGGPRAGVEAWLGGCARGPALERALAAHRAFFADYAGLASLPLTRGELRSIAEPAVVVTGPASPSHVVAAADALAALLPAARRATDGDLATAARSLL